jgi:agmatine deiminase
LSRLARRIAASLAPALLLLSSCASTLLAPVAELRANATPEPPVARADEDVEPADDELAWDGWREPESEAPDDVAGLPGEYEPVERVLFGWHPGNWQYVRFFARVLRSVTTDAKALIAVESHEEQALLMDALASHGVDLTRVDFFIHELDSMWIRDYGPMLVRTRDGGYRVIDLPYHADREHDDGYPADFAAHEGLPVSRPALEMEGGHIQSDGAGRCVISDDVLVRNEVYEYTEDDVKRLLRLYFGCRQTTIVPALFAEETGHVDVFAYVTGPAHVIVGSYRPEEDLVNSRRLNRAARALRHDGFTVTRIQMPSNDHRRVFRTHTNALVTNHTVLVPIFRRDRRHQHEALRAFAKAFPTRRVVGIAADGVIRLAGADRPRPPSPAASTRVRT